MTIRILPATLFLFCSSFIFTGCKKDDMHSPEANPYDEFKKPYTTGVISFRYTNTGLNGPSGDTVISFTSPVEDLASSDFSQSSVPWAQVFRFNENNPQMNAGVYFANIDLNAITYPYSFVKGDPRYAFFNFTYSTRSGVTSTGIPFTTANAYTAATSNGDITVTIVSKKNNRLQGSFSGTATEYFGKTIVIKDGLFDVQIIDK